MSRRSDSGEASMDFQEIDTARKSIGVSQAKLCRLADIHPTTYQRLLDDPGSGQRRTLRKLNEPLAGLGKKPAARRTGGGGGADVGGWNCAQRATDGELSSGGAVRGRLGGDEFVADRRDAGLNPERV